MICPIGAIMRGKTNYDSHTLDCNDMRFAMPQGFNAGDQFFTYLKDTFDILRAKAALVRQI